MVGLFADHFGCSATACISKSRDTEDEPYCLCDDPLAEAVYNDLDQKTGWTLQSSATFSYIRKPIEPALQ